MRVVACAGVLAGTVLVVLQVAAGTRTENIYWAMGDAAGQLAGTCYIDYPEEKPLSVPRTLVVDQNTPDGTVLFQWGYGEFMSDTAIHCTSTGISSSQGYLSDGAGGSGSSYYAIWSLPYDGVNSLFSTTDTGIKLKLLARFNAACSYFDSSPAYITGHDSTTCFAAGTEVAVRPSGSLDQTVQAYYSAGRYHFPAISGSMSLRAELIKQGVVSYPNSSLAVKNYTMMYLAVGLPGGGGIYNQNALTSPNFWIVPPSCQLRTTDYTIPMGRWAADAIAHIGTPAYGPQVPVNLSLECSGAVDHVRFRFEDTGTSLSGNNNISLYDTTGGNKIDGLEIELFYNGTKVNVDNTTVTDTGSHGATKASPASLPLYDSVSTAAFQARYVQNAAVTRAGANYTGPVTGKVNMYVTYD
ncbi:fimbrial protein [Klebsiella oxytoca]|uniref:fimbrial protein n=1 Tax=Klebsiella oxytoca TaxID=571 RepID=UPI00254A5978|nr:fimbrial protein [Klebsiella oxytoca]MEC5505044.1 fimbrial protein [Klebsiella oxytoca]